MHTDLEIQVPTVENLGQSNVLHLRPGVGQNVAMHASPTAITDKVQSLCPLSLCANYCLYVVTVGVADIVNILQLSLSSVFSFCTLILHFFLMWLYVVDIKTQELTTFVFISPLSVHHSAPPPPPPHTHTHTSFSIVQIGIVHKFAPQVVSNWIIMPANPQGHLRIMHPRKGRGWNRVFMVKACLSISLKWTLYNFNGDSSIFDWSFHAVLKKG